MQKIKSASLILLVSLPVFAAESPQLENIGVKKSATPELPKAASQPEPKNLAPKLTEPKPKQFTTLTDTDKKVEGVIDQEIDELTGLLKKYGKTDQRGRLLLRLAEAYGEKAHAVSFRLLEERKSMEESFAYNLKAVDAYQSFLRDFHDSPQAPTAMYLMGFNYYEAKKYAEAEKAYLEVSKRYPDSQSAHSAQLQLAEYYFERRQWDKALGLYDKVMEDKNNPTNLLIARYKISWCHYHAGDLKSALEQMKAVFEDMRGDKSGVSVGLYEESTKSLLFLYGQSGQYAEAAEFLKKIEKGDKLIEHLTSLAAKFREHGEIEGATFLYNEALKTSPQHAKAPYFAYDAIPKNLNVTKPEEYQKALADILEKYAKDGKWAEANRTTEPEVHKFLEGKAYEWALYNHRGLQFKSPAMTFERTQQAYELYLTYFTGSTHAGTADYFYGELLFDNGHFEPAADHYEKVAAERDSTYAEEALINAVIARDKALPSSAELSNTLSQNGNSPITYPAGVSRFQTAATHYLARHPKDGIALSVRYRLAMLDYVHRHFDPAEASFKSLIKDFPKTEQAKNSAHLILDIYSRRGDYEGFVQTGTAFLKNENLGEGQGGAEIRTMTEKAAFKIAQEANDAKKFEKSTALFLAYAHEYPHSALNGTAYFNAAVNLERAGKLNAAAETYEKSLQAADKSQYELSARKALVDIDNKLGLYHQAATQYEEIARLVTASTEKADFLFKAGVLWYGLAQYPKAHDDINKATQLDSKLLTDGLELMTDISEAQKKWPEGESELSRLLATQAQNPKRCAWIWRRAQFQRDGGKPKLYYDGLKLTSDCYDKLDSKAKEDWASVGANAKYLLAKRSLSGLELPVAATQLQKALKGKMDSLTKVDNEFKDVIKLNVSEYIVKSLIAEGEAYRYIARFIEESPIPKGLEGDSLKDYQTQVGGIVAKMDKDSKSYLDLGEKKAAEFRVLAYFPADGKTESEWKLKLQTKDTFN